jgi:hypothetical protein
MAQTSQQLSLHLLRRDGERLAAKNLIGEQIRSGFKKREEFLRAIGHVV